MRKLLTFLPLLTLAITASVVLSIRFFPTLYVSLFNRFSNDHIIVETINVRLYPLSIHVNEMSMINNEERQLANIKDMSFTVQLGDWLRGEHNVWQATLSNADIQLKELTESLSGSSDDVTTDEPTERINIHEMVSRLNVQINNLHLQLDDSSSIRIDRFDSRPKETGLSDVNHIEQNSLFSIEYITQTGQPPLNIICEVTTYMDNDVSKLNVTIPSLNLISMSNNTPTTTKSSSLAQEAGIDWAWLSLFEPTELTLNIQEAYWSKSSIQDMKVVIAFDQSISFTHQARIAWLETPDLTFEDQLTLSGQWWPIAKNTQGADLRGETTIETSRLNMHLKGEVNVNGNGHNALSITLESTQPPLNSDIHNQPLELVTQYFPMAINIDVTQTNSQTALTINRAKLGESDLRGKFTINTHPTEPLTINARLASDYVSFQPTSSNKSKTLKLEQEPAQTSDQINQQIFTDELIDWSWLESLVINLNWKIEKGVFNKIQLDTLNIPVTLSNAQLTIDDLSGKLGNGHLRATANLIKQDDIGKLSLNMEASEVALEQLKLLPPEELKKSVTNGSISLITNGNSSQALANSLNGTIEINVGEGTIGNNSFELIGSDLILGLLNTLNPFSKTDKTTSLECAIINLNIKDGKINIDQSLALRTSKLTIVADGLIDLNQETLKLDLMPKARSGIGLDASSLVKFISLGGTLNNPKPVVTASGLLKSAAVVGAAVSTGGVSLLATNAAEKTVAHVDVCERAKKAFQ